MIQNILYNAHNGIEEKKAITTYSFEYTLSQKYIEDFIAWFFSEKYCNIDKENKKLLVVRNDIYVDAFDVYKSEKEVETIKCYSCKKEIINIVKRDTKNNNL